ncbi:uncharacterized protein LOC117530398 [Thalassophryne amazonica]|uniref:uncharacterized protein LOC117530398 n=1 Tax=Thalassophryne amazonica TaxID=390379 RepID=UPI00147174CF|nr:uncharacterized protein LOC117530398 [Thalassophryne amazonica]
MPVFREQDRTLFLEDICASVGCPRCVQTEPQTENLRPCPTMQAMVRSLVPYIQRFLYHHEELADVYSELLHDDIGAKVKRLYFGQVGKLYIRYQLDVTDSEDAVVELQDVICLLKDKKELYIQKDHLSAKLDICRELVTLFCTENHHRKELMHFLSGLITSLNDSVALKRFLQKEDIRELPSVEEKWEVPEPKQEVFLERVLSSSHASASSVTEPPKPARADGAETLACWPPRASIQNTGASPSESAKHHIRKEPDRAEGGQENLSAHKPTQNPPPAHHAKTNDNQSVLNEHNVVPTATVIPSRIQESEVLDEAQPRPPMNLDIPFWNKADSPQAMLEDIRLTCQRPTTVVFHDDQGDVRAIGTWGEQLVNSFLCQWKDSNDPGRPMHILWCNQNGETGEPYDFKLTFGGADGELSTVYVEVKATVKKEKAFIHLSLNELNFALKKKECYHILRVYSAGDAKNVRLSRIQNVEQHLRTKNLKLYLFI